MMQASSRTVVSGPTFIRLLAGMTDASSQPPNLSLSDRLSQWLDWKHAIALSAALGTGRALDDRTADASDAGFWPRSPSSGGLLEGEQSEVMVSEDIPALGSAEVAECARVRAALTRAIANDRELSGATQRPHAAAKDDRVNVVVDYTLFRERYQSLQAAMQTATTDLRARLRNVLARKSAGMARLAATDAVMELALNSCERRLLGAVPDLLAQRFERLRQTEHNARTVAGAADDTGTITAAWLVVFRKDMQSVLLAELDVRFQPLNGLLAALRAL
jgi:Protein of unknown function (DUF3348)